MLISVNTFITSIPLHDYFKPDIRFYIYDLGWWNFLQAGLLPLIS